jgi:hypothetical protein
MVREVLLARAQAAAELAMVDACTIRRVTGETTDPASGVITPTYLNPNPYTGKCRVQQVMVQSRPHDVGQDYQLLLRLELQLPMSVTGLRSGDEVTITASQDPDLVGRTFHIRDLGHKTDASARRVQMMERTDS